jgi:hypothetical protein
MASKAKENCIAVRAVSQKKKGKGKTALFLKEQNTGDFSRQV